MKAMRERYLDIIALDAAERRGPRKSRLGINPRNRRTKRTTNKKNGPAETAAHEVWRSKTSRGEQLIRRNWEVTAMCISWRRYA